MHERYSDMPVVEIFIFVFQISFSSILIAFEHLTQAIFSKNFVGLYL